MSYIIDCFIALALVPAGFWVAISDSLESSSTDLRPARDARRHSSAERSLTRDRQTQRQAVIDQLVRACALQDTAEAKRLIGQGITLDARDSLGFTPLTITSAMNNVFLTELLLEKGADANLADAAGRMPVHHAAAKGNVIILKILANHGAELDARDNRSKTPLQLLQSADPRTVAWTQEEFGESLDHLLKQTISRALESYTACRGQIAQILFVRQRTIAQTQRQLDSLRSAARAASVQTRRRRIYGAPPDTGNTYSDGLGRYVIESHVVEDVDIQEFRLRDDEFPLPPKVFELERQAQQVAGFALFIAEHCFPDDATLIRDVKRSIRR